MIFTLFALGMLVAFGIARYNESNKVFWQLMLAWVLGYATIVMVHRTFGNDERNGENLVQMCPTQMSTVVSDASLLYLLADTAVTPTKVTALDSVSQVFTPEEHEVDSISSEVYGRTRDQPLQTLTPPPECLTKDFLTLHDSG